MRRTFEAAKGEGAKSRQPRQHKGGQDHARTATSLLYRRGHGGLGIGGWGGTSQLNSRIHTGDSEFGQPVAHGAKRDAEQSRGLGAIASCPLQGLDEDGAFVFLEVAFEIEAAFGQVT